MMKKLLPFLCASALALALGIGAAAAEPITLKIVHFNDLDRMDEDEGKGGVARLAAVVEEVRAKLERRRAAELDELAELDDRGSAR